MHTVTLARYDIEYTAPYQSYIESRGTRNLFDIQHYLPAPLRSSSHNTMHLVQTAMMQEALYVS